MREAKKEGSVVWYAPMNREDLRQFTSGFEAEYPFLKVEVLTSGPQSLLNRILTEQRAGKYNYDTLNIRSSALYTLKKAGAMMRYESPYRKALRPGLLRQRRLHERHLGFAAGLSLQHPASQPCPGAQIHRRPFAAQVERQTRHGPRRRRSARRACWIITATTRANRSSRSLAAQSLQIRKGRTLVSQLVAAGEFPVQIDAHHHEAVALRKAGAPIEYIFPEPFVPVKAVSAFVLSRQPPHPHAAALLGRLHAVEKRPGDRLQAATLAGVERTCHRRSGRRRQPQDAGAGRRQMGQPLRRTGAADVQH